MPILIKLYVLFDFSSVILALNKQFSEKNSFEPIIFQLLNIQNGLFILYFLIVTHTLLMLCIAISYTLLQMSSFWSRVAYLPVLASYKGRSLKFQHRE